MGYPWSYVSLEARRSLVNYRTNVLFRQDFCLKVFTSLRKGKSRLGTGSNL